MGLVLNEKMASFAWQKFFGVIQNETGYLPVPVRPSYDLKLRGPCKTGSFRLIKSEIGLKIFQSQISS